MTTRLPSPWRDLPKELGNWHSVYVRFSRWEQYGVWHRVAGTLQNDADLEELFIDATIVRAHQHAAGAPKKTVAIGRSRRGLTTKVHACVDALGNPIRLILTAGQVADVTQGAALVEGIPTEAVIADKGYDSDGPVATIEAAGAEAIIPPRSNRKTQRTVDWRRYKARNLVERFFNRLKQFRRLATRYDKLANRFNAFLHLACAYIWIL